MPDYGAMYRRLFNVQTDVISLLQQAHRETEEMFVSAPDPDIRLLRPHKPGEDEGGSEKE